MVDSDSLDCTKTAAERRAFGDKLRDLRTARRMSIEAVANATRIQARYIEALEKGAYDILPGEVFARGFVRNVSKVVDADPEAMVADFGRCWKGVAAAVAPSEIEAASLKQHVQKAPDDRRRGAEKPRGPIRGVTTYLAGLAAIGAVALVVRYAVEHRGARPVAEVAKAPLVEPQKAPETPQVAVVKPAERVEPKPEAPAAAAPQNEPDTLDEPRIVEEPAAKAPAAVAAAPAAAAPAAVAAAEPPKPTPEIAQVALAAQPGAAGPQSLDLVVTKPVKVKIALDSAQAEVKDLIPDTYKLSFSDQANLLIYDASALTISYNGRDLGSLGEKGRRRRLSFQSKKPEGASQF